MIPLVRDDGGQALVVIALGMTALLGVAAVAVDLGLAHAQRRTLQNAADGASLAAGRYLLRFVVLRDGRVAFNVGTEDVACEARRFAEANRSFLTEGDAMTVSVELGNGSLWTPIATGPCPPVTRTLPAADTVEVRVRVSTALRGRLAPATSEGLGTSGSAVARLSGSVAPSGPVLPITREYTPRMFECAGCAPGMLAPVTIWSPSEEDVAQKSFKGLLDLSRHSSREDASVEQLLTDWDRTGSAAAGTPLKPDTSGRCAGGLWDTAGGEQPNQENKFCSVPNWLRYTFGGRLSLTTAWSAPRSAGQRVPAPLPEGRAACVDATRPTYAPSCLAGGGQLGDWVETVKGGLGGDVTRAIGALVAERGTTTSLSGTRVSSGPFAGRTHGRAMSFALYLWDCAERYSGGEWALITTRTGDCSTTFAQNDPAPDRVHLFALAPFTVYEGLLGDNLIQGYWGGLIMDPRVCRECPLSVFANTVYLTESR